ncbi:uncharacterized protein LOC115990014 [Quercus lobata]|uniref:uncharacterized protein LOC115990014 n=1 Tax=Quercus lobata TaxID=97700 RepID=UPI00124420EA|nr:uncharacterized protein LOC115990014 [Quercus lobata]
MQEPQKDLSLRPPTGMIHVILTALGRTDSFPSRVLSVARLPAEDREKEFKRFKKGSSLILGFSNEAKKGTIQPHINALVVTLRIGGFDVKRVVVDPGSAVEVMYPDLYKGLNLRPEDLTAYDSPLINFEGKTVLPKGQIRLPIQTGLEVVEVDFIVVDTYLPYTAIVARPWIYALEAISSTLHQKVKFPSGGQVEEIRGDQTMARQSQINELAEEIKCESLERFTVDNDPERFFQVGSELPLQEKKELVGFLRKNVDIFAWDAYDAPGVDHSFICHYLNVNPTSIPKKQPPRHPSKEHANAVRDEVMKLKKEGAIKEVFYPEWLANTVVVRKKTGKWQGYHQIPLALEDQEKTAFMTPVGNYHYKVMPFRLRNAGSTYQRMMTRMFEPQLGKLIEVYIDDMVVKSKVVSEHVKDLEVVFGILREHKLHLNASKCSFGVGSGKFLGYMVTHKGIEVSPD